MSAADDLKNYNHVDLLFPSNYVKAADLKGKSVPVVIERIVPREELVMAGNKKDYKPVVFLRGKEKGWVLNKTNAKSIAKVYGNEITAWLGKTVVIMMAMVENRGDMVEAIRVNVALTRKAATGMKPQPAQPEQPPPPDDDEQLIEQQLADAAREAEQREPGEGQ